ncbi:hypothetical protein GCM10023090_17980 [Acidovorax lacteus]|uniref:DUF1488 family protein n=1 Tax=Acidovorax lacteus TaxID=1924988 RepID=A0ABP8L8V2_9BURK
MASKPAGNAQHGAITADNQAQITLSADAVHVCHWVVGEASIRRRLGFEHNLAALVHEEVRDMVQCVDSAAGGATGCNWLVFPDECDASE